MTKQYFYMVAYHCNEWIFPCKIFLQEYEAIRWGRRKATLSQKAGYSNNEYYLYRQEITRNANLKKIKPLSPYKDGEESSLYNKI